MVKSSPKRDPRYDYVLLTTASKSQKFSLNIVCYNCGGYTHYYKTCSSPKRTSDIKDPHLGPIIDARKKGRDIKARKNIARLITPTLRI